VADTQNNRILIYNQIPTSNGVAADVVLGQPNFTHCHRGEPGCADHHGNSQQPAQPVAVSSDGVHLFVTDLGYNRVLDLEQIPTSNGAAADVEIGQPDMTTAIANNAFSGTPAYSTSDTTNKETPVLCTVSNGTDANRQPDLP